MEDLSKIQLMLLLAKTVISLFIFGGLLAVCKGRRPGELVLKAYENVCMQAKNSTHSFFDYERWENYLRVHGATYFYGSWMNPVSYLALCIITGGSGLLLGLFFGVFGAIACCLIGCLLPGILLQYLNKRDNEKMLPELDMVYSALSIQIRAGVYITDALAECYGSVTHERLRDALQNLSGDIVMKGDLDRALERLQRQFQNRYIDSLCITILQAMESGQAVELLGDIAEQIKDMEITLQHKKKEQLNRSVTFYQLGIFALILVLVLYACVVHMFSSSMFFS